METRAENKTGSQSPGTGPAGDGLMIGPRSFLDIQPRSARPAVSTQLRSGLVKDHRQAGEAIAAGACAYVVAYLRLRLGQSCLGRPPETSTSYIETTCRDALVIAASSRIAPRFCAGSRSMQTPALIPEKTLVVPQQVHLRAPGAPRSRIAHRGSVPAISPRSRDR